ncbi:MAG: DUF4831 family protein [Muribaculaceae bacterium]|nr:DUF4831 family protein [Muribaculaceae bacterium]
MQTPLLTSTVLTILAALLPVGSAAQQTKVLTADKHNEYGLAYSLPVTALEVIVTARHDVARRGPFYQYAGKYMGTDKVVTQDSETWTVTSVDVRPYGVADPDAQFLMQLKPGAVTYIATAEDGMLLGINCKPQAPALPAQHSGPVAVVDLAATLGDGTDYLQYVDEDFIASQSSAKQAQSLSESIMEVRDAKISLTRGTADPMPTDGRQLELMLNSLTHQEEVMSQAFLGRKATETVTRSYTMTPADDGTYTLMRMSDFAGFVGPDDYSGSPLTVTVKTTAEGKLPVDAKGEEKRVPKDAVMYAIPGTARVTVEWEGRKLYEKELDFAQFGTLFGLNPLLFSDRKDPSFATFDPATGALREIGTARSPQE